MSAMSQWLPSRAAPSPSLIFSHIRKVITTCYYHRQLKSQELGLRNKDLTLSVYEHRVYMYVYLSVCVCMYFAYLQFDVKK